MWKFITYEWKYWLRSPMLWILLIVNTLLIFGACSSDSIQIGGGTGSVHKNAPHTIQTYYGVMSLICLLMTTAFMNATANRDFQYDMYQLIFSSPVKKRDYFFGKFIGAVIIAIIPLLGVSVGSILAPLMPWVEPERYGPFMWSGHIDGLISFAIPNIFITGVLLFSLAIIFRNNIVSFVGTMVILVLYALSDSFTQDIQNEWLANILDPFGFRPESILSKYMTVDEQNLHTTPLTGAFLWNRLIWMGIALIVLLIMYSRFSFSVRKQRSKRKQVKETKKEVYTAADLHYMPKAADKISFKTLWRLTKFEIRAVVKNPTFIIICAIGAINLVAALTSVTGSYGNTQYPVTYYIIGTIRNSFYLFLIAIITFYSGVLVWKERDARMQEIQDASPVRTRLLFTSKVLGMIVTMALVLAGTMLVGIVAQLCYGYSRIEPDVYVKALFLDLLNFTYFAVIALFFHYVINNRYIAYFVFVTFVIVNSFIWTVLKVRSNMVIYAGTPNVTYSDMNGFGPFVTSVVWFNVYWSLFALLVLFVAFAFYLRGRETLFATRLRYAGAALKRNAAGWGVALLVFVVCSGFVYYNTKVLNTYKSTKEREQLRVDYEKKYKKYEHAAQPRWYKIDYKIDIDPYHRNMDVKITAWIRNISAQPISEIYFNTLRIADSLRIDIPGSKIKLDDKDVKFRIVQLQKPMQPGDSQQMVIAFKTNTRGFENEVSFTQLTQNGTFFNSNDILPTIGYNADGEMSDKNKRREYKLPVRKRMPVLNDADMQSRSNNYVIKDADWVTVSTTISTSKDQIAVAPGSLVRQWEANGRRYFNYVLDKPSLNFYSFISARYEVARKKWNGIDLEVYYDKAHAWNVPNMLNSIQRSLEYYTANYGPYYHKQARIIEFPRYHSFAQAFPGTMPYSESVGFITDLRNVKKDDIDFVFYIVSHEMGHQYWAHQLCGADMQGSEMMSEGFAQYSALMVMEKEYGKAKMQKFLRYEMDGYLRGRSAELEAERPLMKTENQPYIHYQKAGVVLYYLKEMIGEQQMNKAFRSLLDSFGYHQPPYPTSLAAWRAFKQVTPDSLQYLISDLFENITLFSNRVTDVSSKKADDGYDVTVKTTSEKFYADSLGKERRVPLNDFIDIGIFAKRSGKDLGKPLLMQRVKMNRKDSSFVFHVKEEPYEAGIDPYNYLIDRVPGDNLKKL